MSQCPDDVNIPREEKDDPTETWLITVTETPSMVARYKKIFVPQRRQYVLG